jgi:hypothetical protein
MKPPYDLRHSGITWRLNSGVPATEVAAWAGHSVEMLMRVYARCVAGLEGVWIGRMDQACTWRSHDLGRVWGAAPVTGQHPVAYRDQA